MSDINPSVASAAQNPPASARLEAGLMAPDFTLPSDNRSPHCAARISSYTSTLPR